MVVYTDTIYVTHDDPMLEVMYDVAKRSGYKWTVRKWKYGVSFTARKTMKMEEDDKDGKE